jgi:hypothetical protein
LKEKLAAPVKKTDIPAVGIRRADHATPLYPQKRRSIGRYSNHINKQPTMNQSDLSMMLTDILKTTDSLSVEKVLANIFLLEDGRMAETCSN